MQLGHEINSDVRNADAAASLVRAPGKGADSQSEDLGVPTVVSSVQNLLGIAAAHLEL